MKEILYLAGLYMLTFSMAVGQSFVIPPPGLSLDKGWKWHAGDDFRWSAPHLDDSRWEPIDPIKDIHNLPQLWITKVGWLRLHFIVDSTMAHKNLAFLVRQTGASEIYLNGQLIGRFGRFDNGNNKVYAVSPPVGTFISAPIQVPGKQVLAVRFAIQPNVPYIQFVHRENTAFALLLTEVNQITPFFRNEIRLPFDYFKVGFFFLLSLLHLALVSFERIRKSNFYFFLYSICTALFSLILAIVFYQVQDVWLVAVLLNMVSFLYALSGIFLLTAIYTIFNCRKGIFYWSLVIYGVFSFLLIYIHYHRSYDFGLIPFGFLAILETVRIAVLGAVARQKGAMIIVWGGIFFFVLYTLWALLLFKLLPSGPGLIFQHLAYNLAFLCIPVSISIWLGLEAIGISRMLTQKLYEVRQLSKERENLLSTQNEQLEQQVTQRTQQLHQSLTQLKATQNQLIQQEKLASLGELTAGIAHEIQNPLNFVNNFAELSVELTQDLDECIQQEDKVQALILSADLRQNMTYIAENGQRASSIVQAMLEHSSTSPAEQQPTDLNALVEEYLKLAYHGYRAKDNSFAATLHTNFTAELALIEVVSSDIGRVLLNLFNNAFYALQQRRQSEHVQLMKQDYQPALWVSTRLVGQQIELRVRDNGGGIPAAIQSKVFQPFFTTKPTGEGTGLGLSLSYDIITQGHGGQLQVQSQEGEGTEFIITLPLNQPW